MDADLRQFMKQYTYKMQGPTLRNVGKMMLKGKTLRNVGKMMLKGKVTAVNERDLMKFWNLLSL